MRPITKYLPALLMCVILFSESPAQMALKHQQVIMDKSFWNRDLEKIAMPTSNRDWIFMKRDLVADGPTFFENHRSAFSMRNDDEMRLRKTETDKFGYSHFVFQQHYKNIPVWHAQMNVHQNAEGRIYLVNGKMKRNLDLSDAVILSENNARAIALTRVDASRGLWNFPDRERMLAEKTGNPDTSYFPKGTLVWCATEKETPIPDATMRLCWKFDLWLKNSISITVMVDAQNGRVVRTEDISSSCTPAVVTTPAGWYGVHTIYNTHAGPIYYLVDDCNSYHFNVYNYHEDGDPIELSTGEGSTWDATDGYADQAGATALWCAEETRDYYSSHHDRISWDNAGSDIDMYVNAAVEISGGSDPTNACWGCDGDVLTFGYGNNFSDAVDDWVSIDVVGHEYTHAVNSSEDAVQEDGEPDGLNESFADIFGELVENDALGSMDWVNGTPVGSNRSFLNPTYTTYGTLDFLTESDEHAIGEVQNWWFRLLYAGGSGTNDFGHPFNVQGIGDDADDIIYRSITTYLDASSGYLDARYGSIAAAIDLYGSCSNQAIQVGKAWDAVNVGTGLASYQENVCGTVLFGHFQAIDHLNGASSSCTNKVTAEIDDVIYSAGSFVAFYDGFQAVPENGNSFTAYIEPCAYTILAKTGSEQNSEYTEEAVTPSATGSEIRLYPNPADGQTTLELLMKNDEDVSISISDVAGKIVRVVATKQQLTAGTHQLEIETGSFGPGTYLCVTDIGGVKEISKLVVQH